MAKIPTSGIKPTGAIRLPSVGRGSNIAQSAQKVANIFFDIDRKVENARKTRIINERTVAASKANREFQEDFDENPDQFETINEEYQKFTEEQKKNLLIDVDGIETKAQLEGRIDNIFLRGGADISRKYSK